MLYRVSTIQQLSFEVRLLIFFLFPCIQSLCSMYLCGGLFTCFENFCSSPFSTILHPRASNLTCSLGYWSNVKVHWGRRLLYLWYNYSASYRATFFTWGRRVFSFKTTVFWGWLLEIQVLINSPSETCVAVTAFCASILKKFFWQILHRVRFYRNNHYFPLWGGEIHFYRTPWQQWLQWELSHLTWIFQAV